MVFRLDMIYDAFYYSFLYVFLFFGNSFLDASLCLKSSPPSDKNIQSCVGEMAGSGPKLGKACVSLVLCMVLPGGDALDTY